MSCGASVPFIRFYLIILCTTYFVSTKSAVLTEQFPRNVIRFKREANCSQGLLPCRTGECVVEHTFCDGKKDCKDGSDEDDCNNNPNAAKLIGGPPPGYCVVPDNPLNGLYKNGEHIYQPGSFVPSFITLFVVCNGRYNLSPLNSAFPVCVNGTWSSSSPTCELACAPVQSTPTTNITCRFKGIDLQNCNTPVDGVEATIRCAALHEEPSLNRVPFRSCKDGSWDNVFPRCYPTCGQKRPKGVAQLIGGKLVEKSDYPWHVGIYKASDKGQICGGSIIQDNVVISAAHCFSSLSDGTPYSAENYLVAAGKFYRTYDDPKDEDVQYSDVNTIYIPERYKGEISQYVADIAVLKLKTRFKFSTSVQPVCIDWSNNLEHQQLYGTEEGVVIGWEQTVGDSELSETLRELSVPVIPYERCYEDVPKNFRRYLTYDKICSRRFEEGQSNCRDSGGGLVFEDKNNRFYLRGIVSTSTASLQHLCEYGTYTLVSTYVGFIKDIIR